MKSPGFLRNLVDVQPGERRVALLMSLYFFLVITSFWILKPIKKTLFIGHYASSGFDLLGSHFEAPEAELLAKVVNMFVAAAAATAFSLAARRFRRERLSYLFSGFFLLAYGIFASLLTNPSGATVWSFYLFGDLFSTVMVATFFSFLNDSVSSDSAKRLYGLVGFGGVVGGVFGSTAVSAWIQSLSVPQWLGITSVLVIVIAGVAWAASRAISVAGLAQREAGKAEQAAPLANQEQANQQEEAEADELKGGALAGAALVLRSSYLLSIVAIVGLYELVSTVVDFQFTSAIFEFATTEADRNQQFAAVFAATNWLSMFVQLFLTSFVMRRFGLGAALLVLPMAIALSSLGFFLAPTLLFGSLLSVSDNGFSYSINQSSKEALYVPTTVAEKYQAKAFIDMFVQRFAKALGVGVGLLVNAVVTGFSGIPMLSLVVLPIVGVWSWAAIHAGRKFSELEAKPE